MAVERHALAVDARQGVPEAVAQREELMARLRDGMVTLLDVRSPDEFALGHDVARKRMHGFGGMISFIFDGDAAATASVVDRLKLFTIAASLGGAESPVTQPITTTHHGMTPEERQQRGVADGMIRLSCGLEDAADLIADLKQALD